MQRATKPARLPVGNSAIRMNESRTHPPKRHMQGHQRPPLPESRGRSAVAGTEGAAEVKGARKAEAIGHIGDLCSLNQKDVAPQFEPDPVVELLGCGPHGLLEDLPEPPFARVRLRAYQWISWLRKFLASFGDAECRACTVASGRSQLGYRAPSLGDDEHSFMPQIWRNVGEMWSGRQFVEETWRKRWK